VLAELASGILEPARLKWKPVRASAWLWLPAAYPGKFATGKKIEGLTDAERITGVEVFHAGTVRDGGSIVTSGGRVLGVTAAADSVERALAACTKLLQRFTLRECITARISRPAQPGTRAGD